MIALRAPSIERALSDLALSRTAIVRISKLEVGTSLVDATDADATLMTLDASSLGQGATHVAQLPAHHRVAWAFPLARPGVMVWALSRARRLQPVQLEDACDALRHAGVVDVRVTMLEGILPIALLTGRTTAA